MRSDLAKKKQIFSYPLFTSYTQSSERTIIIGEAPFINLNYYQGYNTITQNSAGDIVFNCKDNMVHVYISKDSYRYDTSFLTNQSAENSKLGTYLGSFKTGE